MSYNIRENEASNVYPEQQHFDIDTLAPLNDVTRKRMEYLRASVPELFERGESFLDIGCAKGFVSHLVTDSYATLDAYEPDPELFHLALAICAHRNNKKLRIHQGDHRGVQMIIKERDETHNPPILLRLQKQYTMVWAGDVHHYFVNVGHLSGAPWLWVQKLKSLSSKYVILDGPAYSCDFAVQKLADVHKWPAHLVGLYNPMALESFFLPQFQLVRKTDNERARQTMVFRRVAPDLPARTVLPNDIALLRSNGQDIPTDFRPPWSVIKIHGNRYKFDRGCLPAGILQLLGHLPWFPQTADMLLDENGKTIGDMCPWVDGTKPKQYLDMLPSWMRMNTALSSVGLFEPGFRLGDYVRKDPEYIDLDYDMVNESTAFLANNDYRAEWIKEMGPLIASELFDRNTLSIL